MDQLRGFQEWRASNALSRAQNRYWIVNFFCWPTGALGPRCAYCQPHSNTYRDFEEAVHCDHPLIFSPRDEHDDDQSDAGIAVS